MADLLPADFLERADAALASTDRLLSTGYPGDDGSRQPVHTVYLPADRYSPTTVQQWGAAALRSADIAGGIPGLARTARVPADLADTVAERVVDKLHREPIEDLRLDFEDGYGTRDDAAEDADAAAAGRMVAESVDAGAAPPFIGIRCKSLEAPTRRRALRTLEIFLQALTAEGPLPDGLRLTMPKVSTPEQVAVLADACRTLEDGLHLPAGRLRVELQMETAPMIIGPDGRCPIPEMLRRGQGRVVGLHYGTYDYSDALQIAPEHQTSDHPAADHAKSVMQVAVAGTGVRLSDGSTNILPVGDAQQCADAWALHARLVRRALERGFYQGWDLHPAQLPTRYLATYAFYRQGLPGAVRRLADYRDRRTDTVLDEPATVRALARFLRRGTASGAIADDEIHSATGLSEDDLRALASGGAAGTSTRASTGTTMGTSTGTTGTTGTTR